MTWVAVGVAAVTVVGGAVAANKQAKAAKGAANAQERSAQQANDTQLQMFNQQREDQSPFRQAGLAGLSQYMKMLGLAAPQMSFADQEQAYLNANPDVADSGLDAYQHYQEYGIKEGRKWPGATTATAAPAKSSDPFATFRNNPGYKFGLDEGNKQVQASAASRGGLNSGATLKALMKYGNDYADQQGFTPYMNRLASLSGMAQTATNQVGAAGQNYANQVGNNLQNAGQAQAQGIYGQANAWSNFGQQAAKVGGNLYGNLAQQNDFSGI